MPRPIVALAGLALLWAGPVAQAEDDDGRIPLCPGALDLRMLSGPDGWVYDQRSEFHSSYPVAPEVLVAFSGLLQALEDRGITVVFAVLPERSTVDAERAAAVQPPVPGYDHAQALAAYRELLAWLGDQGVVTVDLLETATTAELPEPFFLHRERHMTASGSRLAAQVVARAVQQTEAYGRVSRSDWETVPPRLHDPLELRPDAAYLERCGTALPPVAYQQYRARPLDRSSLGLLDEAPVPDVVLVGTSHSSPVYSFPAFLQEALGAEVLPVRVEGGGILSSLRRWLGSEEFLAEPPEVLIWEFPINDLAISHPGRFGFTSPLSYRRLVPAIAGPCSEDRQLASGSTTRGGRQVLLEVPRKTGRVSPGTYLSLVTPSRALSTFTIAFHFAGGRAEEIVIPATPSIPNDGRFYLEVGGEDPDTLRRVEVVLPPDFDDLLQGQLCPAPGSRP